ncbi:hypothetical protein SAMN05216302_104324 [Nitrosomonas aestuarii]|uniref:Uncharacterized protein n=1 Tax=Nitrosomonas aestuarii TaxID=52441 RepID=A0A1I4FVA7_9PROT|nr:hypothetical protein [Nitrosomonas aestuarii]SFL21852.1 hypothetical protein SAMN05216302_104324 [Nitrosomonas aestuarii]
MKEDSEEPGKYGDPIKQRISGVMTEDTRLYTRCLRWKIEKCAVNTQSTIQDKVKYPNGSSSGGSDREGDFAAHPPWNSVNNSTLG